MNNIDIFISAHRDFIEYPHNEVYKIITDLNALSNKYDIKVYEESNTKYTHLLKTINEFTRMWYAHKNILLKDYVGFCHYRRYFSFYDNVPDMDKIFSKYDIIVNKPEYKVNVLSSYMNIHNIGDYYITRLIIMNLYDIPLLKILKYEQYLCYCNIFIMRQDMFHQYCEFVSNVLDEYMKFMNFKTYEDICNHVDMHWFLYNHTNNNKLYQYRLLAFLIERITTIFYKHYANNIGFCKWITNNENIKNEYNVLIL